MTFKYGRKIFQYFSNLRVILMVLHYIFRQLFGNRAFEVAEPSFQVISHDVTGFHRVVFDRIYMIFRILTTFFFYPVYDEIQRGWGTGIDILIDMIKFPVICIWYATKSRN